MLSSVSHSKSVEVQPDIISNVMAIVKTFESSINRRPHQGVVTMRTGNFNSALHILNVVQAEHQDGVPIPVRADKCKTRQRTFIPNS